MQPSSSTLLHMARTSPLHHSVLTLEGLVYLDPQLKQSYDATIQYTLLAI
jgi:hypothetical protein